MKVGDRAYILVSCYRTREVEIMGVTGDGFIVKFTDTGGAICVHRSRVLEFEEEVKKDEVPFKAKEGYHHWELGA